MTLLVTAPLAEGASIERAATQIDRAADFGCGDGSKNKEECPEWWQGNTEPDADAGAGGMEAAVRSQDNCWVLPKPPGIYYKNLLGMKLFGYYLDAEWCSSNGKITSFSSSDSPRIFFPLWHYRAKVLNHHHRSPDDRTLTKWVAASFGLCLEKTGCVQEKILHVKLTVVAGGTYTWSTEG
jgi:hypothetical protein